MSVTPPPCPECQAVTEPIEVEGEQVWRCTAPDCTRRTYGAEPDDDDFLPGYTETDRDGAVLVFHGNGEVDIEATAELAAQDGPGDKDDDQDPEPDAPASAVAWEPQVREVRVKEFAGALAGAWGWIYGDPEGWRFFTSATYDGDDGDTTVVITYSDGEVVRADPWPMARMVIAGPDTIPTATRPGPARMVTR